jgi:gas vesicle structural protein
MTTAVQPTSGSPLSGNGDTSSLADVLDTILDKGLVIDAHVSVAVIGIQLVTIDARVVIASVDTYLRFAEAVNRLDLDQHQGADLPQVLEGGRKGRALGKAGEVVGEIVDRVGGDRDRDRDRDGDRDRNGGRQRKER